MFNKNLLITNKIQNSVDKLGQKQDREFIVS